MKYPIAAIAAFTSTLLTMVVPASASADICYPTISGNSVEGYMWNKSLC